MRISLTGSSTGSWCGRRSLPRPLFQAVLLHHCGAPIVVVGSEQVIAANLEDEKAGGNGDAAQDRSRAVEDNPFPNVVGKALCAGPRYCSNN